MTDPAKIAAGLAVALEAYDDLRRYIYDSEPDRREYSIERFRERMEHARSILREKNNEV